MSSSRKNIRFETSAGARIQDINQGTVLLKDISITGCRLECVPHSEIKLNTQYQIKIIPEEIAKIGIFDLVAESKWVLNLENSCEVGFSIVESPKKKQFQHYVDYLSWCYSHGKSMIGSGASETHSKV